MNVFLLSGMTRLDLNRDFVAEVEKLPAYAYYKKKMAETGRNALGSGFDGRAQDVAASLYIQAKILNDYAYQVKEAIKIETFMSNADNMRSTYPSDKHFLASAIQINGDQLTVSPSRGKYSRGLSPVTIDISMGSNDTTPEANLYRKLFSSRSGSNTYASSFSGPFEALTLKMDHRQAANIDWEAWTGLKPNLAILEKRYRAVPMNTFQLYLSYTAELNKLGSKIPEVASFGSPVYSDTSSSTNYSSPRISRGVDEFTALVNGANTTPIAGARKNRSIDPPRNRPPAKGRPIPGLRRR